MDPSTVAIIAAAAAAAFLIWKAGAAVADMPDAVGEVLADGYDFLKNEGGVVPVVGDVLGVPRTNMTECERAKAEGRTWDASFACPAGDFIKYVWS